MSIKLLVAALLPAVALCIYVFKKDRVEKEPIGLLLLLFGLGALSCLPIYYVERFFHWLLDVIFAPLGEADANGNVMLSSGVFYLYHFLKYFIGVALVEEGFKFLFLVLATKKNKNFNCLFDGMIYAIFVSLGFAALENIKYVANYGFIVAIRRAVLSVPTHMFCAVLMGYYYSLWHIGDQVVRMERDLKARNIIRAKTPEVEVRGSIVLCLLIPTLAHGFYDFCCTLNSDLANFAFYAFVIFLYIHCFKKIRQFSVTDGYTGDYANGLLVRKYPELFVVRQENEPEQAECAESQSLDSAVD
ncbi:MAG: PrsW family intramembrane metalloprotease [Oscillospiraceae bacterium]|nr:PrsW family intramembrane metalloprotease [Oscillospiraceae bacterium]